MTRGATAPQLKVQYLFGLKAVKNLLLISDIPRLYTVVDVYINTMETTCQFRFRFPISFFLLRITSFQVNKKKQLIDSFSLFPCLCISMLCRKLGGRAVYGIVIYDDDCRICLSVWIVFIPVSGHLLHCSCKPLCSKDPSNCNSLNKGMFT